jgi:hypothetical protein
MCALEACTRTYHQLGHLGPGLQDGLQVGEKIIALHVARHQHQHVNIGPYNT